MKRAWLCLSCDRPTSLVFDSKGNVKWTLCCKSYEAKTIKPLVGSPIQLVMI
jgi:hypothetical protein